LLGPELKIVNAFEAGENRKAVAILDFKDWATKTGATYGKGYEDTGYFNRNTRKSANAEFKLDESNNYRSICDVFTDGS
jgi:hypothetical protein